MRWLGLLIALPAGLGAFAEGSLPNSAQALGPGVVAGLMEAGQEGAQLNPGLLGGQQDWRVDLRYQDLLPQSAGSLIASGAALRGPLGQGLGWGMHWAHQGSAVLAQDRLALGAGWRPLKGLGLGANVAGLFQQASLSAPMPGLNLDRQASAALDFGLGGAWNPLPWLALGAGVDQLSSPNLGLSAAERLPPRASLGLTLALGAWRALLGHEFEAGRNVTGLGLQWRAFEALALRAGGDASSLSAGFQARAGSLSLSYAYTRAAAASAAPDAHALELGWNFEGASARQAGQAVAKAQSDAGRARRFAASGSQAEGRGDYFGARQRYEWALQLDPALPEARHGLERLELLRPKGALSDARVLRALEDAAALRRAGREGEARAALARALGLHPGDAVLTQALEDARAKPAPAAQAPPPAPLESGVARLLDESEALARRGQARLAGKLLDEAEALAPGHAEIRRRREALKREAASPADQKRSRRLLEQGLAAYLDGRLPEAVKLLEQAVEADAGNAEALNNLTRARIEMEAP